MAVHSPSKLSTLQEAGKVYLVDLFDDTSLCTIHKKDHYHTQRYVMYGNVLLGFV